MPKVHYKQTNFTSGQLGPRGGGRLLARVDLAKYFNGAKEITNCLLFKTGGLRRRPGLRKAGAAKNRDKVLRLRHFLFSNDDAIVLEFGDLYLRFWKNGAIIESSPLVPYELTTPYPEADLAALTFQQSADVLYIGHRSYEPRKLARVTDTNWQLSVINFQPPAATEKELVLDATITPSAVSGTDVTITADSSIFLEGDKDRIIISGAARAVITAVAGTSVTVDILDPFPNTNPILPNYWAMTGSPLADLDLNKTKPLHAKVNGTLRPLGQTSGTVAGLRSSDVGKFVKVLGGMIRITSVSGNTGFTGEILSILKDAPDRPRDPDPTAAGAWSIEETAWTADDGYPIAPLFHEERLMWVRDQDVWGSVTADFENHASGSADDDAIHYRLATNTIDVIEWLVSDDKLYLGTAGGIHSMAGAGQDEPLTADPPKRRRISSARASAIAPLLIEHAILFPEKSLRQLKEIRYDFNEDDKIARELTDLNETILESGVREMAYQSVPDPRVWIVCEDGKLVTLTYYRIEDVLGWTVMETDGLFESIAIIPHPDGDREQIWVLVAREIDGLTERYIEYFDDKAAEKNTEAWSLRDGEDNAVADLFTDSAVVITATAGQTEVANLNHLEGKTVVYSVNGAKRAPVTVNQGRIALSRTARAGDIIEIGLPYTHRITTMPPEIPQASSIQGVPKRWSKIWARFLNTCSATIEGQPVTFLKGGDSMDLPPPLFTGDKEITDFRISDEGTVTIEGEAPEPFTLLSVHGYLHVGDS